MKVRVLNKGRSFKLEVGAVYEVTNGKIRIDKGLVVSIKEYELLMGVEFEMVEELDWNQPLELWYDGKNCNTEAYLVGVHPKYPTSVVVSVAGWFFTANKLTGIGVASNYQVKNKVDPVDKAFREASLACKTPKSVFREGWEAGCRWTRENKQPN